MNVSFGKFCSDIRTYNAASKISIKIDGVKEFTFRELLQATNNFNDSAQVGRGGYGKVYRGILGSGTTVAVKRAEEGSLQGKCEFLTEIQFLSRLHHRNLVSLVGYCGEDGEQVIVLLSMTFSSPISSSSKITDGDWNPSQNIISVVLSLGQCQNCLVDLRKSFQWKISLLEFVNHLLFVNRK